MKTIVLRLTTLILFSGIILSSCSKDDEKSIPVVNIANEATVTSHSAALTAVIESNGASATSGGFYWSRKPTPTASDSVISATITNNMMLANLEGLPQGQSFYYAAFAQNADGIGVSTPKKLTLVQNAPQMNIYINNTLIGNEITMQKAVGAVVNVKCSMQVPMEFVLMKRLRISYDNPGFAGTLVDLNITGTETEYTTEITFSNSGVVDLIFELFDEHNNVCKKTITVTVE